MGHAPGLGGAGDPVALHVDHQVVAAGAGPVLGVGREQRLVGGEHHSGGRGDSEAHQQDRDAGSKISVADGLTVAVAVRASDNEVTWPQGGV